MPRSLVLGNGRLLVAYDSCMRIRDFYYPHAGLENHAGGKFRTGVWCMDGFSWLDDSWERESRYGQDTLASDCRAENEALGIGLEISEAAHPTDDALLKKIVVKNLSDSPREIRVFLHHDFDIYGENYGDTAAYLPEQNALLHYKRSRFFLCNGHDSEGKGIFEYATGYSGQHKMEGTWKDAEDGRLEMNPIAQGSVDSTMSFRLSIGANSHKSINYWIACAQSMQAAAELDEKIRQEGFSKKFLEAENYWKAWVGKHGVDFGDLPASAEGEYRRSLLVMRTHVDDSGAVIASCDRDIMQFNRDTYNYCWMRDGARVAYAFDIAGYREVAREFFKFASRTIEKGGYFLHKYAPDGSLGSSWHPWVVDGKPQVPLQEDETALVLHALWNHYQLYNDVEFVNKLYRPLIVPAAEFLCAYRDGASSLTKDSYDLWEERLGVFSFSAGATYAGLEAAANFAKLFSDGERAFKYSAIAHDMLRAIRANLYDQGHARFLKMCSHAGGQAVRDATIDSSACGLWRFGALPAADGAMESTMRQIEERLWVKTGTGGLARYESDYYHRVSDDTRNIPGNPWVITTLWLAQWHIAKATTAEELEKPRKLIEWAVSHALPSGLLAEQVNPHSGAPLSVSPLTWSHAEFVIAVREYIAKLHEIGACPRCAARQETVVGEISVEKRE